VLRIIVDMCCYTKGKYSRFRYFRFCAVLFIFLVNSLFADELPTLRIYLSADRTGLKASGLSIEQGIRTAIAENGNLIAGRRVELKILDHRGSTPRANKHLKAYLDDPSALVLFSGLHSPPLLAKRDFINENEILVLDPWAAAAPITRYPSASNWIFRLSIDDSKAGGVITDYAVKQKGARNPALFLEQTGWGKSNQKNMLKALNEHGLKPSSIKWFNWGLTIESARILIRECLQSGADSIFFVGNAPEGKTFARAMASLPENLRLPIFSHWGITGGNFAEAISHDIRKAIKLKFIQTSFSFLGQLSNFQQQVLDKAYFLFPDRIKVPQDIKAPTGFIHAYDLTRILIAAANQVNLGQDIKASRATLRKALENLKHPIQGLIKTYDKPFSVYSEENPDAHEALGANDYVMAGYSANNEIVLETSK